MRLMIRYCLPWYLAVLCVGECGCTAQLRDSQRPIYDSLRIELIQNARGSSEARVENRPYALSTLLRELDAKYVCAEQEEQLGLECCVDHYYESATRGWQYLEGTTDGTCDPCWNHAWRGY